MSPRGANATLALPIYAHPWLRLNVASATMLSTRGGDQWLTVKAELGKALALQRRHAGGAVELSGS